MEDIRIIGEFADGFAVIANCCAQTECDAVIAQIEKITGAGTRCLLDHGWCQTLAGLLRDRIAAAVPEIGSLVAVQCTYFNKSAESNWLVPFHQDRSIPVAPLVHANEWTGWSQKEGMTFIHGPDDLLAEMIAVRLHLDDSTAENGPLRVIPGSHRAGTLLPEEIEVLRESVGERQLIVRKGGVILMRPLLLHASSRSRTVMSRRVLHFLYGPAGLPGGLEWRRGV